MDRNDDESIMDQDRLLRRVPPQQVIREDDGTIRPSTAAFKDEELSVNIEALMLEQKRKPEETLVGHAEFALTSVTAGDVREFEHPVVKDVEPPSDPAHGLVLGKKKDRFAKTMVRRHQWVVPPPGAV